MESPRAAKAGDALDQGPTRFDAWAGFPLAPRRRPPSWERTKNAGRLQIESQNLRLYFLID